MTPRTVRTAASLVASVICVLVVASSVVLTIGRASAGPIRDRHAPALAVAFDWPLDGVPHVVRPFAPPPEPWLAGHRGVDLGGIPGQAVRAAGPGTIVFAGPVAGRNVVSVSHQGGLRTTYEPVRPLVSAGQRVTVGDVLGSLVRGHPGCLQEACLHWGLRRGETYLDPLLLVQARHVRLKPMAQLSSYAYA